MVDLIDRQAAIDGINGLIDRFEKILFDIREANGDDSVCGLCEYDGAFVGESGDWCTECPGFDKEDCFELRADVRKKWLESVELPSADQEEFEWCHDCKEYDQEQHCCHRFTKTIRDTVEEIKAQGEWIPCSERLPEENDYRPCQECLDGAVWYSTENGTMGLGYYYESTKVWSTIADLKTDGKVVAWMPLPKPYKGGEDE